MQKGLSVVLLFMIIPLAGCETVKHTVTGLCVGMGKDVENISEAFSGKTDAQGHHQQGSIQKADAWIQENLW